ncbi:hypothetical protein Phi14:2_gp014 [Cellulophaga phage phi14:2]|uniref:Uncharacterized protein n=1 Tax=Cellulophaga phage phi14:2 TaxID=1327990 RepID=S0A369_9CAUD|nr:hypothetical protein Phi14:2_gp014 [Cellulophaga phage phi14:2]
MTHWRDSGVGGIRTPVTQIKLIIILYSFTFVYTLYARFIIKK